MFACFVLLRAKGESVLYIRAFEFLKTLKLINVETTVLSPASTSMDRKSNAGGKTEQTQLEPREILLI